MALVACKECGSKVSTEAKACPKCGAKVPHTKWRLWVFAFVLAFFIWVAATDPKNTAELAATDPKNTAELAATDPKNTAELAEMETASCIRSNGYGAWRGSLGVTLEAFCKATGELTRLEKACKNNPSKC